MRGWFIVLTIWISLAVQAEQVPAAVAEMLQKNNVASADISIWVQANRWSS